MFRYMSAVLCLLCAITGCAAATTQSPSDARNAVSPVTSTPIASATAVGTVPSATSTIVPQVTRIIVLQQTSTSITPAPLPTLARRTVAATRVGWQTYSNASLHLALDYPPGWTVRVQDAGAIFSSPGGVTIQLEPSTPNLGDEMIQPNTRCSTAINPYGVTVQTCLATIGTAIDAHLDLASSAAIISTRDRAALDVLNAIVDSARIVP